MAEYDSPLTQLTNAIPDDPDLLAAIGRVTVRHTQLDYMLRMAIKSLLKVRVQEALDATVRTGSAELRRRVLRLAKHKLGDGRPYVELEALIERCRRATEKRNVLVHAMFAGNLDTEQYYVRTEDHQWEAPPSADELVNLSRELLMLANEVNFARLEGFLHEALNPESQPGRR